MIAISVLPGLRIAAVARRVTGNWGRSTALGSVHDVVVIGRWRVKKHLVIESRIDGHVGSATRVHRHVGWHRCE